MAVAPKIGVVIEAVLFNKACKPAFGNDSIVGLQNVQPHAAHRAERT